MWYKNPLMTGAWKAGPFQQAEYFCFLLSPSYWYPLFDLFIALLDSLTTSTLIPACISTYPKILQVKKETSRLSIWECYMVLRNTATCKKTVTFYSYVEWRCLFRVDSQQTSSLCPSGDVLSLLPVRIVGRFLVSSVQIPAMLCTYLK